MISNLPKISKVGFQIFRNHNLFFLFLIVLSTRTKNKHFSPLIVRVDINKVSLHLRDPILFAKWTLKTSLGVLRQRKLGV